MPSATERQRIVWRPLPGSQVLAMACPADIILFEGTRGPGKTDSQLMRFRRNVGRGYGRFWRGVIFDREYKNLDDLVSKSLRWFPQFGDGARFLSSRSDFRWVWPTGEELLFRQMKKKVDYWNYHGQEFPFIGWNEITKQPTSELFDMMMSCNRSSFLPAEHSPQDEDGNIIMLPEIPLEVFATTNPYGPGHMWVKRRFIDPVEPGQLQRKEIEVFNPRTQDRETIVKTTARIFGSYKENRYLAPEYVAELESIKDENKRKAWLWGDWDIVAGGAFDDVWGTICVLPRFKVPAGWRVDRSFDWGSSHPFSVGWWAEANGEEATLPDGSTFCPPAGTLIRICEWYGTKEVGTNQGLKLGVAKISKRIKEIEAKLREEGWIAKAVRPGPADNQIYDTRQVDEYGESDSLAAQFEANGIEWEHSDKSPGSRKNGLQLARDRFEANVGGEDPGLYATDNCKAFRAIIPVLPRDEDDPDDVDTTSEDHIWDETRYRVLKSSNRYATKIKTRHAS